MPLNVADWVLNGGANPAGTAGIEIQGGRPITEQRSDNPRSSLVATASGKPRMQARHRLQVWQLLTRLVR
jgi:hypothetical protein